MIHRLWTQILWTRFHISFLNHFPNFNLVNDGGTVGIHGPSFQSCLSGCGVEKVRKFLGKMGSQSELLA